MNIGYEKSKTHNKVFIDVGETSYMNKCLATALINFNPAHYQFDVNEGDIYNPVQLTHVSDNLAIGSIPIWDVSSQHRLTRKERKNNKFEIVLLDDKSIPNFNAPSNAPGWPLLYVKSSCGIDIGLSTTNDCFTVNRHGYAHVTNYGDVIEKNDPVKIRTKYEPPNPKEYLVRVVDKLSEVLTDYADASEFSPMRIKPEHILVQWFLE